MRPAMRVTGEQKQGSRGHRQVEERFDDLGWEPRNLSTDLGEDLIVDIYDQGASAGLAFYAQIKSSSDLDKYKLKNGGYSYPLEVKDLNHWRDYYPPVVLIIWNTTKKQGYWLTIADAIAALDKNSPGWQGRKKKSKGKEPKVNVQVPQANALTEGTLNALRKKVASIAFPAFAQGKELSLTLTFSFSDDPTSRSQRDAVRRFLDTGEGVAIDGKFLSGIEVSDWYERKFGKPVVASDDRFIFGPRHSNAIEKFRLTLLTPQGRIHQVEIIEAKAARVGDKQITFTNEHLPTPFLFHLTLHKDRQYTINISLHNAKSTAGEALRAYSFFEGAHDGGVLRIEILTNTETWHSKGRIDAPIAENTFPKLHENFRLVLEKLHYIEIKTGVTFSLTDEGIGKEDWELIHEIAEILETGRRVSTFKKRTQTLHGAKGENSGLIVIKSLLESWRKNEPVSMDSQTQEASIEILGTEVPLGAFHGRLTGHLEPKCAERLEKIEKEGISPQDLEFVLVNGKSEEELTGYLVGPSALPSFPENN